jgi:DNA repair protein RadC
MAKSSFACTIHEMTMTTLRVKQKKKMKKKKKKKKKKNVTQKKIQSDLGKDLRGLLICLLLDKRNHVAQLLLNVGLIHFCFKSLCASLIVDFFSCHSIDF